MESIWKEARTAYDIALYRMHACSTVFRELATDY